LSENWRVLDLSRNSVRENLALEEALARSRHPASPPTMRVWVNPRGVVVGRFQEVSAEVNVPFCEQNNIQVGRRFTGGGAVFHDEGNLNLTVVSSRQRGKSLNDVYKANSAIISNMLEELGVRSDYVPPNSIEISGKKVSGSAAALGRDFAFWHASVLVSTNEQMLNDALQPSRLAARTHFIRSKWQPIATLQSASGQRLELGEIKRRLIDSCETCFGVELERGELSSGEERVVKSLYDMKYSKAEWNLLGLSPNKESLERKHGGTHTTIAV
jgi:lipoate-protein ligase A